LFPRNAQKREGTLQRVTLDEALAALEDGSSVDLLDLNAALDKLAALDARQARLVELRVFGGLTIEEAAEVLECSPATVKRDWNVARLFLPTRLDLDELEFTGDFDAAGWLGRYDEMKSRPWDNG